MRHQVKRRSLSQIHLGRLMPVAQGARQSQRLDRAQSMRVQGFTRRLVRLWLEDPAHRPQHLADEVNGSHRVTAAGFEDQTAYKSARSPALKETAAAGAALCLRRVNV